VVCSLKGCINSKLPSPDHAPFPYKPITTRNKSLHSLLNFAMFSTTVEVLWVTRLTNSRNRWVYTAQKIITIGTQTLLMHKDIAEHFL